MFAQIPSVLPELAVGFTLFGHDSDVDAAVFVRLRVITGTAFVVVEFLELLIGDFVEVTYYPTT